jgi:predicted kinase
MKTPTLTITVGLPGSGKSTFAKKHQRETQCIRVSKDDFRLSLFANPIPWNWSLDKITESCEEAAVIAALKQSQDVIVDATNLTERRQKRWKHIADTHAATFVLQDFRHVSVYECVKNDLNRPNKVGAQVILEMARRNNLMPKCDAPACSPTPKLPAIMIDIDGTVARMNGRSPYDYSKVGTDEPIRPVLDLVESMFNFGCNVFFCSGRPDSCRGATEAWLSQHTQIPYTLLMRKSGDSRKDYVVKMEIYKEFIEPGYDVKLVIDDRDQVIALWRSLGLTCLQADYGNF